MCEVNIFNLMLRFSIFFSQNKIEPALILNQFKNRDENIMALLHDSWAWIKWGKFDAH